ncbi:CHAT domain-containing protein [Hassallia byssoidea VB512170]|uniref:CHAT domain-containing protein n=1 Tax=Hassallia byssoidea VB512170 TaxID=1304833 RepID=A0A846HCW0_9CYAN|nr:CHAT domain-containing protein [Hassalia byssoidea]NEU75232.1 CHAT domain-containing protein [Hassalia byssoidea VB512170]
MNSDIPVKILFLAADPSDESRLRLFQELRDIKARLQIAKSEKYQLEQQESVRVGDITQAIFDIQPQIIHFSGHGKSTGELCFENEVGKVQPVKPDALAAMFKLFSLQVNCVVLNACYSEIQAVAIAQHIPFVIGMNDAIGDKAAIAFAVGFYKALAANRSIEDAYQFGCVEIQLQGIPEHLKPGLYTKEHYKPEVGRKKEERSPFITGTPITDPRYFFGRNYELKRLFNLLKRHPLQNAAIIGKKRSGKTSLLHYLKNITTTPAEDLRLNQKSDCLPHPENYKWIFVDFQDQRMANRERLLSYILESLGMKVPNPCNLDYFMDLVSENLHNPTVILLDEIGVGLQRCPELDDGFWECLRSLATNSTDGNLAFILATHSSPIELAHNTGHSSPFFNIFGYTATLGALTEAEARELIASSPIPFSDEDVEWILTQSRCFPLLLQILCMERLFILEDGDNSDDWRDEGLRQMQPFAHLL